MESTLAIGAAAVVIIGLAGGLGATYKMYGHAEAARAIQSIELQTAKEEAARAIVDKAAAEKLVTELQAEKVKYEQLTTTLAAKTKTRVIVRREIADCGSSLVPVDRDPFIVRPTTSDHH